LQLNNHAKYIAGGGVQCKRRRRRRRRRKKRERKRGRGRGRGRGRMEHSFCLLLGEYPCNRNFFPRNVDCMIILLSIL